MKPVIAIHGGAGVMRRDNPGYRQKQVLARALDAGYETLEQGKSSLDAVCAAVLVLEDSPLFNAGRGSCFNADGEIEMDASIMDGADLRAGAVAVVRGVANPVVLARTVMDEGREVFLVGSPAEALARRRGLRVVAPEDLVSADARRRWRTRDARRPLGRRASQSLQTSQL